MSRPSTKSRARACLPPLTIALLLAACGGGGGETPSQPSQARADPGETGASERAVSLPHVRLVSALTSVPTAAAVSGLEPRQPQVIDATPAGERVVKAVGALDGGGYAVAWMARGPLVPGVAWELWVQRFNAQGFDIVANTPAEASAFFKQEIDRWSAVVKQSGATVD